MISSRKLINLARKWQKMAAMKRQRIPFPTSTATQDPLVSSKGHFVVYTADNMRFTVPLVYLSRNVFIELLRLSEEEFGLPSEGPITLPCDSTFFKYAMSLIKGSMPEEVEKALLTSLMAFHFSASSSHSLARSHHQTLICSY